MTGAYKPVLLITSRPTIYTRTHTHNRYAQMFKKNKQNAHIKQ
jgi:hypothetical protein